MRQVLSTTSGLLRGAGFSELFPVLVQCDQGRRVPAETRRDEQVLGDEHGTRKWPHAMGTDVSRYFPTKFFNGCQSAMAAAEVSDASTKVVHAKKNDRNRAGNGDTSGLYLAGYSCRMLDPFGPQLSEVWWLYRSSRAKVAGKTVFK